MARDGGLRYASGMSSVTVGRVIAAPIDRVWAVFTDISAAADRIAGINSVEVLSEPAFGPGFRWRETRTVFGRSASEEMWVTDLEAPRFYEVAAASHGTEYLSRYTFAPVEGGTRVSLTFSGTPVSATAKVMGRLTGWIADGQVGKMLQKDLDDLVAVCERAVGEGDPGDR